MRTGDGLVGDAVGGRKRLSFMGVDVVVDWWVSLRMRPPEEAMVASVVNVMMGFGRFVIWRGI